MSLTSKFAKLILSAVVLSAPAAMAGNFVFHIDLNTTALTTDLNAPFFLDFQLNKGDGTQLNSITLQNFVFTGGTPTGSATTSGLTSGSLGSTISLSENSSNQFSEFYQAFTASTTEIQFDVVVSQHSPGATPDQFALMLLDSESGNPPIFTNAPDTATLLGLPIRAANALGDISAYSSTSPSPSGVTPVVTAVPEPSSVASLIGGVAMLLGLRRKRS